MDALHMGIEFDAAWVFHPKWKVQLLFSLGDWTWQSQEEAEYVYDRAFPMTDAEGNVLSEQIDVRGVHVGDAAQFQVGGMLEFLPTKNSYVRARYTFFGRNFSNFDPSTLVDENGGRESWQIPNYQLVDFFAGYRFKLSKGSLNFGLVVNNVFNTIYITDAQNNDPFKRYSTTDNFDAASATIFPGLPRRYSLSITLDL
jgi:outer membrane receptor protein involved in Fe transport